MIPLIKSRLMHNLKKKYGNPQSNNEKKEGRLSWVCIKGNHHRWSSIWGKYKHRLLTRLHQVFEGTRTVGLCMQLAPPG